MSKFDMMNFSGIAVGNLGIVALPVCSKSEWRDSLHGRQIVK